MKAVHRIKWLDFAKFFTIICVVFSHSIGTSPNVDNHYVYLMIKGLTGIIHIFMMPMFFAISGYLYKSITNFNKYKLMFYKKFTSILIPSIIFVLINVSANNYHMLYETISNLYKFVIIEYGDLWFLNTLFFCFIIMGIVNMFHSITLEYLVTIIFIVLSQIKFPIQYKIQNAGANFSNFSAVDPIQNVEIYYIIFFFGYLLKRFNVIKYLKKNMIFLILSLLWILITGVCLSTGIGIYKFNNLLNIFNSLLGVLVLVSIFIRLNLDNENNKIYKFSTQFGKYTLVIYLVHWPIVYFIIPHIYNVFYIGTLINNFYFMSISKFIISLLVSILICYLIKHIDVINFLFYPRKYINELIVKTKWGKDLLSK